MTIVEHVPAIKFSGNLYEVMLSMPHRQKLMWLYRIEQIQKSYETGSTSSQSTATTPEASQNAWTQIMAQSMIPRGQR